MPQIVCLGRGWYSLTISLPRERLRGCSCKSPLAHFYIQHGASSIRELHPFTTITHLATQGELTSPHDDLLPIQLLFRKSRRAAAVPKQQPCLDSITTLKDEEKVHPLRRLALLTSCGLARKHHDQAPTQWTEKIARLADVEARPTPDTTTVRSETPDASGPTHVATGIRCEGPYFTPADPSRYETVICFVAGTGVSGALAIAAAFAARGDPAPPRTATDGDGDGDTPDPARRRWSRLVICWSVRAEDHIDLPFDALRARPGLEMRPFLTGAGRPRVDVGAVLREVRPGATGPPPGRVWAYISGPGGFIGAAEAVCKAEGIDYYGARWDI